MLKCLFYPIGFQAQTEYRIPQMYKVFTLRVERHAGLGRSPLEAAHGTKASRFWVPSRTEGAPGPEGSTNRWFCEAGGGKGGMESS